MKEKIVAIISYLEDDYYFNIFDAEENKDIEYKLLDKKESKQLLDYIINLQLKIDKAIEYIKSSKTFDDIETARIIDKYEKILLEILQGSDKE